MKFISFYFKKVYFSSPVARAIGNPLATEKKIEVVSFTYCRLFERDDEK